VSKLARIAGLALGGLVVAIALGAWWLYRASQAAPAFYQEVLASPHSGQADASDELLHQATRLTNRARRAGSWEATFTAEQINGWLAVDFLKNHAGSLPPGVSDPRVEIKPEGVTVACRWDNGTLAAVLSLQAELYVAEPNVLALRIHGARAGSLPLPLDDVLDGLSTAAENMEVGVRWLQADGDPVAMITIPPPEGERDTRIWIESIELGDGQIHLAGRTLAEDESPDRHRSAEGSMETATGLHAGGQSSRQ
jgi:hypothetical protein